MDLFFILALLFVIHYLGDFFIQIYAWRTQKKWVKHLIIHTLTYVSVLALGLTILNAMFPSFGLATTSLVLFLGVNTVIHFVVDLFVRQISDVLYEHEELTAYTNVLVFDQCLHYVTLLITFGYFFM